jgi:hypothetical protein
MTKDCSDLIAEGTGLEDVRERGDTEPESHTRNRDSCLARDQPESKTANHHYVASRRQSARCVLLMPLEQPTSELLIGLGHEPPPDSDCVTPYHHCPEAARSGWLSEAKGNEGDQCGRADHAHGKQDGEKEQRPV